MKIFRLSDRHTNCDYYFLFIFCNHITFNQLFRRTNQKNKTMTGDSSNLNLKLLIKSGDFARPNSATSNFNPINDSLIEDVRGRRVVHGNKGEKFF